jgi:hypothetical protein
MIHLMDFSTLNVVQIFLLIRPTKTSKTFFYSGIKEKRSAFPSEGVTGCLNRFCPVTYKKYNYNFLCFFQVRAYHKKYYRPENLGKIARNF